MQKEKLLRPSAIAKQLEVHRGTVYRWIREGKLRGLKLTGGTIRVFESSLEEMLRGMEL